MRHLILILTIIWSISCHAQSPNSKFNLDFEQNNLNNNLPDNWIKWGNYEIKKDMVIFYSGKCSALIVSDKEGSSFGSIAYKIPANYNGNKILLTGYMKIEKVENGFAGLLLRVDSIGHPLAFDNMEKQKIAGTKDWTKYSITLPYPKGADNIYVAGILSGKGKAWFDHLTLTIDGKDVQTFQKAEKTVSKFPMDKEFDNGSNFRLNAVNKKEIEKLYKLCKIWGFLKYHHPKIAKGEVNWDDELFRMLPKIYSQDFESEILKSIKALGSITKMGKEKVIAATIKIQPNTRWISDDSFLKKELSQELTKIDQSRREQSNYYISFAPVIRNPIFQNENLYPGMKWEDTGYRLLALFRYWNMIEYFFPYKNLIEEGWDEVLKEYIPKMVACHDELAYKLTILSLIGEIHDTHANMGQQDKSLNDFFGNKIVPLEVKFAENKVVIVKKSDLLSSNLHINVGDIITEINGIKIEKIVAEKINYCPASNYTTKLRDVSKRLLRTNANSVVLTLENPTITYTETVNTVRSTAVRFQDAEVASHSEIGKKIGYIYPGTLKEGEIDEIMKSFRDKKGIVIDLRCYPSDFIVFRLGKYLMPEPTEFAKFTTTSLKTPGLFTFLEPLKVGEKNPDYYKGKVVILIDEKTQSQAEYTTMALRVAPKATVIGSTTAGADGDVSSISLPGNIRTMISGKGVYYPNGSETQRIGIVPDIEIKPTIARIREGKDEVLDKAIELINKD